MINIIAAIGENRELGKNNQLLWHIPEDLKHFKEITQGHPVIMGRKTFESLGRPLPKRTNIVITRDPSYAHEGIAVVGSLGEAIKKAQTIDQEVFVIGGGQIYTQALPLADKLYLTLVSQSIPDADTFFPDYSGFRETKREEHQGFVFTEWVRLSGAPRGT